MGQFITELIVDIVDDTKAMLINDFKYLSDIIGDITVPAGFITDFASVPRIPIAYLVAGDIAHKPAVIHDWLYRHGLYTRKRCDDVFCEAMGTVGIALWRRYSRYLAVRVCGWGSYRGYA